MSQTVIFCHLWEKNRKIGTVDEEISTDLDAARWQPVEQNGTFWNTWKKIEQVAFRETAEHCFRLPSVCVCLRNRSLL